MIDSAHDRHSSIYYAYGRVCVSERREQRERENECELGTYFAKRNKCVMESFDWMTANTFCGEKKEHKRMHTHI